MSVSVCVGLHDTNNEERFQNGSRKHSWKSSEVICTEPIWTIYIYVYVFYTMVTQKYAIKSHLTSLLSSRNHSTIPISVY